MFKSLTQLNKLETTNINIDDYESFVPDRLRAPTGNKIKKASFEEINPHLYENEARMAAFRVPREKILPYIQALHCIFFDNNRFEDFLTSFISFTFFSACLILKEKKSKFSLILLKFHF